jgi:hypothetical protein
MANKLIYPFINPLQLFDPNYVSDPRYNTRDFIDYEHSQTILPWEQDTHYCQPWQKSDSIWIQLQTNTGPVNFVIKKCEDDSVVATIPFVQGAQSGNEPGLYLYEIGVPLAAYQEGDYYVVYEFGLSPVVFSLRTGCLDIREKHEASLYLEFKHFEYREGWIFETGLFPAMRVHGVLKYDRTTNKSTTYADQEQNETSLRNIPFRLWKLFIGDSGGIPDYMIDKISRQIGCSTLLADGKGYTKPADKELEPKEEDNYTLRGWEVELKETKNRTSREFENNIPLNGAISIAVSVDSKGFGNSNTGSNTAIIDVI